MSSSNFNTNESPYTDSEYQGFYQPALGPAAEESAPQRATLPKPLPLRASLPRPTPLRATLSRPAIETTPFLNNGDEWDEIPLTPMATSFTLPRRRPPHANFIHGEFDIEGLLEQFAESLIHLLSVLLADVRDLLTGDDDSDNDDDGFVLTSLSGYM